MLKHLRLDQCDSTQDELKRHLNEYQIVSTKKQLDGRGRGINSWDYVPGAIAFSFLAPPHPHLSWQSLEVAISLAESLEKKFGLHIHVKWPNDLYFNGHKIGGILLHHQHPFMIIGVGINLLDNTQSQKWRGLLETNSLIPINSSHEIPEYLVSDYIQSSPQIIDLIRDSWLKRCEHLNKLVQITDGTVITRGIFEGLGPHGEAIINGKSIFNGSLRWELSN